MNMNRSIYLSIDKFLREEIDDVSYSSVCIQQLKAACNCLEMAFNIKEEEILSTSIDLRTIYRENISSHHVQGISGPINNSLKENQKLSDICKAEGNKLMEAGCYEKAIESYTEGISYCKNNAICYCNRAAAFGKLNLYSRAIEDCKAAIQLNSRYSKAYARMGLYCSKLGQLSKAVYCYKMALEIDPNNQSYIRNLDVAKMKFSKVGVKSCISNPGSTTLDLNNNNIRRDHRTSSSASSTDECYHSSTESLDGGDQYNRLFDKLAAELLIDCRELSTEDYSSILKSQEMQEICLEFLNRLRLIDSSFVDHIGHDLLSQLRMNFISMSERHSQRKHLRVTFES